MPRFFSENKKGSTIYLDGEDAKHISKVLRKRVGDTIVVCDGLATDYNCTILSIDANQVVATIVSSMPSKTEPNIKIRLFQALPKSDKLDFIVQKAVELGVTEIVPMLTTRCVSRPDTASMEKKKMRLQRISYEAAKQSGRGIVPKIASMCDFKQAIDAVGENKGILCYEKADTPIKIILENKGIKNIDLFIGAEGGFEEEEVAYAKEKGIAVVSLGNRILRCETAPIYALSVALFVTEDTQIK